MNLKYLSDVLKIENLSQEFVDFRNKAISQDTLLISQNQGERVHLAAALEKPIIYVAKDTYSAIVTHQKLKTYDNSSVLLQPNEDLLFYRKTFPKSIAGERVKALYSFANKDTNILVTSPMALIQMVPKKNRLLMSVFSLKVGDEIDTFTLADKLVDLGYIKEEMCEEKNTFSVHGDIVDVFLSHMNMPIRISFEYDKIDNIKTFDVETMLSLGSLNEVMLLPNNDLLFEDEEIKNAIELAKKDIQKAPAQAAERLNQIIDELSISEKCTQSHQWLIPYLSKSLDTIFDYRKDAIIVFDEVDSIKTLLLNYSKEHQSRVTELRQKGEITKAHLMSILSDIELQNKLSNSIKLGFSNITSSSTLINPKEIIKLNVKKVNNYILHYERLLDDLKDFINAKMMVILCQPTKERAKVLAKHLQSEDVVCTYLEEKVSFKQGIFVVPEDISDGFIYPTAHLALIGVDNIARRSQSEQKKKNRTSVFVIPQVGDYVVHEFHGIGKCLGLKRMKSAGIEQDFILVEYKDGGLLYVPTSQMNRLSRYSGSEAAPKLSSLGGHDFAKLKDSVKKSLKNMAIDLVDLYAKRMNKQGFKYSEDDELMMDFENGFEYVPTDDQIEAIKDIKQDMEKGIIMDRLLCGDVGYGKTEVALRAIFKTVLDNKQAAILVPTTVLAQQHYNTAKARFAPYGVDVELISRLKTKKEIEKTLERLKSGESQVVVATHRLLSKDVQFKDLGLLVLDEEQRFGVQHKEKLKVLKNNLNVLTLSATPIPRTLNMSLIGVRDISVLDTPPVDRLPIQTSVTELTDALIEDVIKRELARDGQVFILYNEVETINRFADDVRAIVPEARVVVGHGQMSGDELEDVIDDFYSKRADVLVCTTIIENGIDIKDANSLIVCNADKLGLSQLYQLRGRVGRSNRLAYAYFTVSPNKILTDQALKRLNAIMDYTELGSGFKIAMRDLEIRGAGSILGKEQHGHIEKVGYDMYCKLLQEAVDDIRGIKHTNVICQVDALIDAYLSTDYVKDDNSRLKIFRDILDINTKEDIEALKKRLKDSFGEVPTPLENLMHISLAKNIAQELMIEHIVINNVECVITFVNADFLKSERMMEAMLDEKNGATILNEAKPKVKFNFKVKTNIEKLDSLIEFMLQAGA